MPATERVARRPERAARAPAPAPASVEPPDILRALGDEHKYQARLLKVLERQVGLLNQKQVPDYLAMRGVMRYMTQFPDRFHHPKEDLLFEKIVLRDPSAQPQVQELLDAHESIIAKGAALLAAIEQCHGAGEQADTHTLRKTAHAYIGTLRRHMDIEYLQMFPLALRVLKPEDWAEVERRMKPILDPVFSEQVADEFKPLREAEEAKPEVAEPGRLTSGLIEAAALIEAVATLIQGATKLRKDMARHQKDTLRMNAEFSRDLMRLLPLSQRFELMREACERNIETYSEFNQRMIDQWSAVWKAAWSPYDDEGPYAPRLLRWRKGAQKKAPHGA